MGLFEANHFLNFADYQGDQGGDKDDGPIRHVQVRHVEELFQEGNVENHEDQSQGQEHGLVQAFVREEAHFKEGVVDASRGEGAEQFAEDQGGEGHGARINEAVAVHAVGGKGVVVHAKGRRRNGEGLNDDGDGDVSVQNRFFGIPRRFVHGFFFAFFHAEGQRREGVGD